MILGLSTATFTLVHVVISLIGILAGAVVLAEMIAGRRLAAWNAIFLVTTVVTSVTGFFFHADSFAGPQVIGGISLAALAVALFGALPECLRRDRAGLPKTVVPGGAGPPAIRAAVPRGAIHRARRLCDLGLSRRTAVSARVIRQRRGAPAERRGEFILEPLIGRPKAWKTRGRLTPSTRFSYWLQGIALDAGI